MRRVLVAAVCAATVAVVALAPWVSAAAARPSVTPRTVPAWLVKAQHQALLRMFRDAKPVATYRIWYPAQVAVIFEFKMNVICNLCSGPSESQLPHGRVIRVTFDRKTHFVKSGLRFCEVQGASPPLSDCLLRNVRLPVRTEP
jgi:hypothetical protein